MDIVLELADLHKTFVQGEKKLEVLRGIDLQVKKGELVALVGSSGSGKSTLLQLAGLLDHVTSGDILIDGKSYVSVTDEDRTRTRRHNLGFVYQFHHLLPDFTALENTALAGRIQNYNQQDSDEKAKELLVALGLEERLDHTPSRMSGGEQQRVAIARALMGDPDILLADEPTGNLDDEASKRVFDQLIKVVRDKNVAALIATHDRKLAGMTDRQLRLHSGVLSSL